MKTRVDGILFLLQPISSVVIKQVTFSQNKSPFPDPDSSLPKAILKTSGVGLRTYFLFLKHLQLSSSIRLDKERIESLTKQCQTENLRCLALNDTLVLPIRASVGTCPVERDVLQNIAFEGSAM